MINASDRIDIDFETIGDVQLHDVCCIDDESHLRSRCYDVLLRICAAFDLDPHTALFVEDMARNLAPAKAIGMTTVWVDNGSEQAVDRDRSYIDFTTHDITHWLQAVLEAQ